MIRTLKFFPRHKYKIATFGVMPTIVYRTYVNAMVKRASDDISINTSKKELMKINSNDANNQQVCV